MIICLKNADFSASNLGKVYFKDINLNTGEGTNNPLMFKYSNATGAGEYLGVDFVTKENPSPFSTIRKLHKGGTGAYLYSVQYDNITTLDFPRTPENISMAIWINKTSWESFRETGNMVVMLAARKTDNSGWINIATPIGEPRVENILYTELASQNELSGNLAENVAVSGHIKRKILDTKVVNGETWVCVGIVWYGLAYDTSQILENSVLRIIINCGLMDDAEHYFEIGNLQVVNSPDYLIPDKDYSL